jgi:hypothetical protein
MSGINGIYISFDIVNEFIPAPGYRVSGVWEKMRQFRGSVLRKTS